MSERLRDRAARRAALTLLRGIDRGRLTVAEPEGTLEFGPAGSELAARIDVHDARTWSGLLRGSNGLGEAYIAGSWDTDDLVALARVATRNLAGLDRLRRLAHPVLGRIDRLAEFVPRNTREGARAHIAAHYDLGNELFAAFLDERLMYSCAWFPRDDMSLDEAQVAKLDRICERLQLGPGDHLLEIGTGWGGLAIHAASEYGCRVTTTTISREQRAYALGRIAELGLEGRITVLDRDYRDLEGTFDKLVSVEMIEAVGWQYFETFFSVCSARLDPEGLMLLQAIVIDDELYEQEKAARTFANTHIFPGGCLPSERLIGELIASRTDLRPAWSDDITASYARTLALWRERFNAAVPELEPKGYDRRFQRLWNFYLAISEAGFRERRIRDLQLLYAKPEARIEPTAEAAADPALA
jgi:cyclopropane-fatty-acyl-phospholipid synthase